MIFYTLFADTNVKTKKRKLSVGLLECKKVFVEFVGLMGLFISHPLALLSHPLALLS